MRSARDAVVAPRLGEAEVRLWIVDLDAVGEPGGDARQAITSDERARAARLRAPVDRRRFVQRRTALRRIVAAHLGVAPLDLVFELNAFGKPALAVPPAARRVSFNASSSGAMAVIAVARAGRIGVDIEALRPGVDAAAVASRFFAPGEAAALAALDPPDRVAGFFNAWTRKEALIKGLGGGLSIPLDAFDVSLRPQASPAILRWAIPAHRAEPWRLHAFEPGPGWVGALATDFEVDSCHCRAWPA